MNTNRLAKFLAGEAMDADVSSEAKLKALQTDLAAHKKVCEAQPGNCPKEKALKAEIEKVETPKDKADEIGGKEKSEEKALLDDLFDMESILGTEFKMASKDCTDTLAKSQLRCGKDLIQLFQKNDDGSIDIEIAVENPAPNGIDYELGNGRGYRDVWEDEAVLDDYKRVFSDIVDNLLETRGYHGDENYDFGDWEVDPGDNETLIYSVHAEPDEDVSSPGAKAKRYLDRVAEDWAPVHPDGTKCRAKSPESCPFNQSAEKGDADVTAGAKNRMGVDVSSWDDERKGKFAENALDKSECADEFSGTDFEEKMFYKVFDKIPAYAGSSASEGEMLKKATADVDDGWEEWKSEREDPPTEQELEDVYRESQRKADLEDHM